MREYGPIIGDPRTGERLKKKKKSRRKWKREKLIKKGVEQKGYSPDEKISEELCKFLFKSFGVSIKIASKKELKGNSGDYDASRKRIRISEEVFSDRYFELNRENHEHVLFHELGHLLSDKFEKEDREKNKKLSRLSEEAVAEMYYYMVISGCDEAEAEKSARDDYRNKRLGWIDYYGEEDPSINNQSHVDWRNARKRAIKIYESRTNQRIMEITGYGE